MHFQGRRGTILLNLALVLLLPSGISSTETETGFPLFKGKFNSNAPACAVSDALIDYGGRIQIALTEGTLYRRPDDDFDFFFVGQGEVIVRDTGGLEVAWHDLFGDAVSVPFQTAYLCGRDLPAMLGIKSTSWTAGKIPGPYRHRLPFLVNTPDKYFGISLPGELALWSLGERQPLPVWVDIELSADRQLVFALSPEISEQLQLYIYDKKFDAPFLLGGYSLGNGIVSQPVDIDSTWIDVRLKESGRFDAVATLYVQPGAERPGVMFHLPFLFTVDSVHDASGRHLDYIKKLRRTCFYVAAPSNDTILPTPIIVYYRGKFLAGGEGGVSYPVNMTTWFPSLPRRILGGYTIRYTLRKDLALVSVGRKIAETISGDNKIVTYRADNDISYISFAAGIYDTLKDSTRGIPLTLYIRHENSQGVFNRHIPKKVMTDLKQAAAFFSDAFGPPLATSLEIVDQPLFSGQSSPGLIHLSQVSFETERDQARFRAHEVAHQWWGHTAVPQTFRDMWLSEGLSEFSAALYLLNCKKDTVAYNELVDTWRRMIVQEGKIGGSYSRGYRAGPIIMGIRFLQTYSPGDYAALVYAKAAYMLQMLRFEIDGPSYRTDFFSAMLNEYLRQNRGGQASSVDFIRAAGHFLGPRRAQGFFQQWLYNWKIPDITCRSAITLDDHNRQMVTLTFDVQGVATDFETPFPIEIEFVDGDRERFRLDGIGRQREHMLGPFPERIKNIHFDPAHIILVRHLEVVDR